VTNSLQFAAREVDETGYVYMRSRYYDCGSGRFISEDPAGLDGGLNAYEYVGDSPINDRDPSGSGVVITVKGHPNSRS
jgi:RHS repeat-associated protein